MSRRETVIVQIGIAVFLGPASAVAQGQGDERRIAVSVHLGLDPAVGGQFNRGAETSGLFGTMRVHDHSFAEIYRQPWRFAAEISYRLAESPELAVRFAYTGAGSRGQVEFREFIPREAPPRRIPAFARFSDYSTLGVEGGVLWRLSPVGAMRPYAGAVGGLAVVRTITVEPPVRRAPPVGPGVASNVFYARSVVPTIGAIFGSSFVVRPNLALGLESGLRYQGRPDPDPPDMWTGPWLNTIYDGYRWSIPVTGVVQFRF